MSKIMTEEEIRDRLIEALADLSSSLTAAGVATYDILQLLITAEEEKE